MSWRKVSIRVLAGASLVALATSCGESVPGETINIPVVNFSCSTAQCRTNSTPWITVTITSSSCNLTFITQGAVAVATLSNVVCTGAGGCTGQASSWTGEGGASVTTMPSGTYSVCGRIDYNRSMPDTGASDTTATYDGQSITTAMPVTLSGWIDP